VELPAHADTITGTVISIADGDTITVLDANHEQRDN
jgi:endonuclease YncB( thermonuclease family)